MSLLMLFASQTLLKEFSGLPAFTVQWRRNYGELSVSKLDFMTVMLLECSEPEFPQTEKLRRLVKEG